MKNKDDRHKRDFDEGVTFDDVSLVPGYSDVLPMEVDISTVLSPHLRLQTPVLSAAMDTVTEYRLAKALADRGGLGVVHKNMSPQDQAALVKKLKGDGVLAAAAVGPVSDARVRAPLLVEAGVDCIVVDTAHGDSKGVVSAVELVRKLAPMLTLVAGNIVTADAARRLADAGADAVKVGVGPGSICTTRVVAGVGVPQLSAIRDVCRVKATHDIRVIADGGIRFSGDAVKALAAGADAIMVGSMLAATEEAPGETVTLSGVRYKRYRGMGSLGAMVAGSKDRYAQGSVKEVQKLVPEGIEGRVRVRGSLADVLGQLVGGVRSGMGYLGASTLTELCEKARFVRVSGAGLRESHPHDVYGIEHAPNYEGKWA